MEKPLLFLPCTVALSRMGVPTHTPLGKRSAVSRKAVKHSLAYRAVSLFTSPAVRSDSCRNNGIFSIEAATHTGKATKPPLFIYS